jgi:hypothetical protein
MKPVNPVIHVDLMCWIERSRPIGAAKSYPETLWVFLWIGRELKGDVTATASTKRSFGKVR